MNETTNSPLQAPTRAMPHPAGAFIRRWHNVKETHTHCHPEFTAEATLAFLPMFKQQHTDWFPMKNKTRKASLTTSADYMTLWQDVQAGYTK